LIDKGAERLEELIGRAPDAVADRRALTELREAASPAFRKLVRDIYTREDWRCSLLGALLPGLALVLSPRLVDLLGVRAFNTLTRAELTDWSALAACSPVSLAALPGVGPETVEEVTAVAVREWAAAYLHAGEGASRPGPPGSRRDEPARGHAVEPNGPSELALAFEELEKMPSFDVLKRRQLDPGKAPSLAALAAERGLSKERIRQMQATIRGLLESQTRDDFRPIRVAAEAIRDRLGAVARTGELDAVFAAFDPAGIALPAVLPHRRVLLLQLADYRASGQWTLGPDIESLTRVVLETLADSESTDLGTVGRHLSRLGVREELQLPWIVHQWGFRIVDGRVLRLAEG
jgi:hypothetical protein